MKLLRRMNIYSPKETIIIDINQNNDDIFIEIKKTLGNSKYEQIANLHLELDTLDILSNLGDGFLSVARQIREENNVYNVGLDIPWGAPENSGQFKWVVFYYENGYYDGSGQAVCLREDNQLEIFDLGHCSCYGPFDDFNVGKGAVLSIEDYFKPSDNVLDPEYLPSIKTKVRQLLNYYDKTFK